MKIKEPVEKVKTHVREHKEAYIAGSVGVLAGAAGVLIFRDSSALVSFKETMNLKYKSPTSIIAQFIIPALGDPGNVVQSVETGTVYASQGQAARELGVDPSVVSRHLKGVLPDVKGAHLKVIGKAGHPLAG
jgi:hypothetical protein